MEATLLDLSRRVENLERKLDLLQNKHNESRDIPFWPKSRLTPAERGALLIERARRNAAYESKRWGEIFDAMGIPSDPTMTREKVQQMYLEAGFDPEANDFARGIIAMREE
ncbi:MAG: hypothetical protein ONB44_01460 [candidate division KSB1 bacterium]|nr:hypothetical protein [candidate division KSB1 bacterium]MDZ7300787.1 hypothetical protein [candidate division KSB1 bacterium]MDZ7309942.1 hypothetical protein [candidate division KSB1 bacterium]